MSDTPQQPPTRAPEPPAIVPTAPPRPIDVLPAELVEQLTPLQRRFLTAYAVRGTLLGAAQVAKVHRCGHHRWLEQAAYAKAFERVHDAYADLVEDEVRRRALEGWYEPRAIGGECRYVLVKSDKLLELHVKARRPKLYRERLELSGEGGGPIVVQMVKYAEPPAPTVPTPAGG